MGVTRASIKDVAAMAGVSHQTVSRVINRPDLVAPPTRARVERAIRALGFHPNASARALRTRHTHTVGVLVGSNTAFVAMNGLSSLELALRAAGLHMLMTGLHGDDFASLQTSVGPLLERDVDALVIAANHRAAADLARELARTRTVVALQPGVSADDGLSSCAVDFGAAVRDVIDHLHARGDRVLDFIPGPAHFTTVSARTEAWIRELGDRRLPLRPLVPVAMSVAGGRDAGLRLVAYGLPDAVFCVNDLVAMGVLQAFREQGVRVPDDVAVVGMDNLFGTDQISPSLTTVEQPWAALGTTTGALVVDALAGRPPRTVRLSTTLVVRDSTAGSRSEGDRGQATGVPEAAGQGS